MYTALYRAERPEVFDEILGQDHIVRILRNQIDTETVSHAYLFCGTRGTGKTTTARILAKGLNCISQGKRPCGECSVCRAIKDGTFMDVIEIDAASNNGVENIRELRESVKYPPAIGRKKVYIIDEVHMLSQGAFNALLKTLEEPPEYVVFILATTEPHKLPATILSRCMRLDFRRVSESVIIRGMKDICKKRGINVSDDALRIIAANADGSVRDGLSILDQCIAGGDENIDDKVVLDFLGASGEETFIKLTDFVRKGRTSDALKLLAEVLADGKDVRQFMRDWVNHYRNLLMTKFLKDPQSVLSMSNENIDRIRRQSESVELEDINRGILELSQMINEARWSSQPRILLEMSVVKLSSKPSFSASLSKADIENERVNVKNRYQNETEKIRKNEGKNLFENKNTYLTDEGPNVEESVAKGTDLYDYDNIWKAVFEDGEAAKGSFYIIGRGARLVSIDENSFTVLVDSEPVRMHAERNRDLLETLLEKHTGKKRVMKISDSRAEKLQYGGKDNKEDIQETVKEAENILGINVTVK